MKIKPIKWDEPNEVGNDIFGDMIFGHTPVGLSFMIEPTDGYFILSRFSGAGQTKSAHDDVPSAMEFAQEKYEEEVRAAIDDSDFERALDELEDLNQRHWNWSEIHRNDEGEFKSLQEFLTKHGRQAHRCEF